MSQKISTKKKIVTIGGGTGSFTVLSGLRKYDNLDLTAIVAMADDGGSTGVLRDEHGVLPPGDIRQCLVALSDASEHMRELFNFRFEEGSLKGHNFGNLFISAAEKMTGNFNDALSLIEQTLNVRGDVVPVTLSPVRLIAELKNGKKLHGEREISEYQMISRFGVKDIYFDKKPEINEKAIHAMKEADMIVVGPGGFFNSLVPNFLVPGCVDALASARAKKVLVANIMNKYGHTDNFTVPDFLRAVEGFIKPNVFDVVVYNTKLPSKTMLKRYVDEGEPVEFGNETLTRPRFIGKELLHENPPQTAKGDMLRRNLIRHDPDRLAQILFDIVKEK